MAFVPLKPRVHRHLMGGAVTVAFRSRQPSKNAPMNLYINVARVIREDLGWPEKGKIEILYDAAAHRIRVELAPLGSWALYSRNGTACLYLPMPHIPQLRREPQVVPHKVVGAGILEFPLPAWAEKPGIRAARDARVQALGRAA